MAQELATIQAAMNEQPAVGRTFQISDGMPARVEYAGFNVYAGLVFPVIFGGQQFFQVFYVQTENIWDASTEDYTTERKLCSALLNPRFVFSFESMDEEDVDLTQEERVLASKGGAA